MKKVLLGTTAIAASALIAGPAAAQDGKISLGVGGYYENFFTVVSQDRDGSDNDYNDFNVRQEGEIHFSGETTLDNGLTVGFQAQLEAVTQADQMDETYLYFTGSWGRLLMGSENSAPYLMQYAAPSAGLGVNSPNIAPYQNFTAAGTSTYLNRTSDANKITYFTPRFSGFQLGASYTPNIDARGGNTQSSGLNNAEDEDGYNNFFGIGANFVESFSGFDVALAGGLEYGTVEDDSATTGDNLSSCSVEDTNLTGTRAGLIASGVAAATIECGSNVDVDDFMAYSGGVRVGFSGFTVGGSVLVSNGGLESNGDTLVWDLGATYGVGPWTVGATYLQGETETGVSTEDTLQRAELGGRYRLSPGVTVVGALQWTSQELDNATTADREEDAWGVVIGTRLNF